MAVEGDVDSGRMFFEALSIAKIAELLEGESETLHLEFKTVRESPNFASEDKKNLAKALSGFANADGGVVVWGIDCRQGEDGVDCAQSEAPLRNVAAALSRIQALTPEAVSPCPRGIEHRAYEREDGSGFMATYVPATDGHPHMAKFGEDRYYRRAATSFRRMEHFEVADMFGRRAHPDLRLFTKPICGGRGSGPNGEVVDICVIVGIENIGRGIARFPYLEIECGPPPYKISPFGLDGNRRVGLPERVMGRRSSQRRVFAGGVDHVVHPSTVLEVTQIETGLCEFRLASIPDVRISFVIGANGVAPIEGNLVVTGGTIQREIDAP